MHLQYCISLYNRVFSAFQCIIFLQFISFFIILLHFLVIVFVFYNFVTFFSNAFCYMFIFVTFYGYVPYSFCACSLHCNLTYAFVLLFSLALLFLTRLCYYVLAFSFCLSLSLSVSRFLLLFYSFILLFSLIYMSGISTLKLSYVTIKLLFSSYSLI